MILNNMYINIINVLKIIIKLKFLLYSTDKCTDESLNKISNSLLCMPLLKSLTIDFYMYVIKIIFK